MYAQCHPGVSFCEPAAGCARCNRRSIEIVSMPMSPCKRGGTWTFPLLMPSSDLKRKNTHWRKRFTTIGRIIMGWRVSSHRVFESKMYALLLEPVLYHELDCGGELLWEEQQPTAVCHYVLTFAAVGSSSAQRRQLSGSARRWPAMPHCSASTRCIASRYPEVRRQRALRCATHRVLVNPQAP